MAGETSIASGMPCFSTPRWIFTPQIFLPPSKPRSKQLSADLQERLWAERTAGSERRVLLVLQGMDTSGKGGVLRHTIGLVDPQGVRITSFKAPTDEEKQHDFLWRIEKELPGPGLIGVFDRSHYEDVLIHKVRALSPES